MPSRPEGLPSSDYPARFAIEGGVPLLAGDQVVGAIGVSGVMSEQDGQVAQAGVKAFAKP